MITNNSIKEYYTKLQGLYSQCYDMLTTINKSMSTKASEISMTLTNVDGTTQKVKVPSFLYLENRLEELSMNMSSLYSVPKTGEAWMSSNGDTMKIVLEKNNVSPVTPTITTQSIIARYKDNNFLKDLVSPKTYVKIDISNLPIDGDSILMKKIILHDTDLYDTLNQKGIETYGDFVAALYNYKKGSDYDEYDNTIDLPIKSNKYTSNFNILAVDDEYTESSTKKVTYTLHLDTIEYYNIDDTTISYTLKPGDIIYIDDNVATWKVKNVNTDNMEVRIEEVVGHVALQTTEENSKMTFHIYDTSLENSGYAEIPLEEDTYVIVFLAIVRNGIRSEWSSPLFINLSSTYVMDEGGNYIQDSYGNNLTYTEYYKKYCTNIGDLILGITKTAYPQVSNYTSTQLQEIEEGTAMQQAVSNTFDEDSILQVVPINKHLVDDVTTDEIKQLHEEKAQISQQLLTLESSINEITNTLATTDFSKDTTNTQENLKSQLTNYYNQRIELQKQQNSIIDTINVKSTSLTVTGNSVKYRVRGVTSTSVLDTYIKENVDENIELIGLDVEYKYKSTLKDTTSVTVVNSSTFSDWNKLPTIERDREVVFTSSGYGIEFVDYNSTSNIIKWNQIDIPIQQGEDVVIRLRYKLNIGQPFMSIYTPWSDEKTITFPSQYKDDIDLTTILDQNSDDTITAAFSKTLIEDGYASHIQDKVVTSEHTFYHIPESIYSGFNTPENKMISLKDKLYDINSSIEDCKTLLDENSNASYEVYLQYDDVNIPLSNTVVNNVNIYNNTQIKDIFIKKKMKIVIKNTGSVRLNLYSIFPGNTETPLLNTNIDAYNTKIVNYERIPLIVNNEVKGQVLGQYIYFRENSPWTGIGVYLSNTNQNLSDENNIKNTLSLKYITSHSNYMAVNNAQVLLGYRSRTGTSHSSSSISGANLKWRGLALTTEIVNDQSNNPIYKIEETTGSNSSNTSTSIYDTMIAANSEWYIYPKDSTNNYLMRYEDIVATDNSIPNKTTTKYLDESTTFTSFNTYEVTNFKNSNIASDNYYGAFLFPELETLDSILTEGKEKSSKYVEVGESISIPITLEYYVDESLQGITKSIYFDLRPSLIKDPDHYMISIKCNYDYTTSNSLYSSTDNGSGIAASSQYT